MAGDGVRRRTMRPADVSAVRRLFADTIAYGRPVPFDFTDLDRYAAVSLDFYLRERPLADHAVLDDDGTVVGYTLVCVDEAGYRRWSRRAAARWTLGTLGRLVRRRYHAAEATFHRLRLVDGLATLRSGVPMPMPAHAHLNVARRTRGRLHVRSLIRHIDERCAAAGLPGWYGEINTVPGRRAEAFVSHGAEVVHRQHNRTLSWLAGRTIERMTVARPLDAAVDR